MTAQKRHDWYRTTGRDGRWVMPDWSRVAEMYGGVHLTVTGYLAAAGTAIDVDDDAASVIAGWAPDETHWLTDASAPTATWSSGCSTTTAITGGERPLVQGMRDRSDRRAAAPHAHRSKEEPDNDRSCWRASTDGVPAPCTHARILPTPLRWSRRIVNGTNRFRRARIVSVR